MLAFIVLLIIISALEIPKMLRNKEVRELTVFICLLVITFVLGYIHITDPYGMSISSIIMNTLGIQR